MAALVPAAASAQAMQVDVTEAQVATAVVDRMPEGAASTFPSDVGELYFFTRVAGTSAGTQVQHVWYRGDEEMARVSLNIGSANWRT